MREKYYCYFERRGYFERQRYEVLQGYDVLQGYEVLQGWRKGVRISWSVGGARVRDVMYQLCRECKDVGCDG